ncbi:MAG: DNA polymerase III subunit beta [Candidatus Pristimantibacillus sp.]
MSANFMINSTVLKSQVVALSKAVKGAVLGECNVYIRDLDDQTLSFYFSTLEISAEKYIPADIVKPLQVAVSVKELNMKVSVLPDNEMLSVTHVLKNENTQFLKFEWGTNRKNTINVQTLNEQTDFLITPTPKSTVVMNVNKLFKYVESLKNFALKSGSDDARNFSILTGIAISSDENGKAIFKACNRQNSVCLSDKEIDWLSEEIILDAGHLIAVTSLIQGNTQIEIGINEMSSLVIVKSSDTTCVLRTLSGKYPVLEQYHNYDIAESKYYFDRSELLDICQRAIKVTAAGAKMLLIETKGTNIFASVSHVMEQQLSATVEGMDWSFTVDAERLFNCAKLMEGVDEIVLYLNDPGKLISIGSEDLPEMKITTTPYRTSAQTPVASTC